MPSNIEEIKSRLDIVDLIGEYIKVQRSGANFKALCPFHNEKTASLIISSEKQIWHCFGCHAGGDHFKFVQQMENVEFPEALRILAKKANVKLEYQNPELHNQKTRLLDLSRELAEYWHQLLLEDSQAQAVREYLAKRLVRLETVKTFQLGYAKDAWDDAIKFLQSRKYSLREMELAGVSISGQGKGPYDRFRGRLIFPIRDFHGNVVGFTARKMKEEDQGGKYINSPQSLIYDKSAVLYNLDLAKAEIKKKDYAILVEGNMDAIACYQAGTKNTVAISGTALTQSQIALLKRYTQNVMIAFDADAAGLNANLRGIDLAWQAGLNVKVVHLSSGKDPDEVIKTNLADWLNGLKSAENFMDYLFQTTLKDLNLSRVDHKKKAAKKLLGAIAKLGDNVEQSYYLRKLAEILGVSEQALAKTLSQTKEKSGSAPAGQQPPERRQTINQAQALAERFLAFLIKFPDYLEAAIQAVEADFLNFAPAIKLYRQMIIYYNKEHRLEAKDFFSSLETGQQDYFNQLSLLAEFSEATPRALQHEFNELIKRLKNLYLKSRLQTLEQTLKLAQESKQSEQVQALSQEFSQLLKQLQEV